MAVLVACLCTSFAVPPGTFLMTPMLRLTTPLAYANDSPLIFARTVGLLFRYCNSFSRQKRRGCICFALERHRRHRLKWCHYGNCFNVHRHPSGFKIKQKFANKRFALKLRRLIRPRSFRNVGRSKAERAFMPAIPSAIALTLISPWSNSDWI